MAQRWKILLIAAAAAVMFLGGLGRRDIITSHEARVAQTAKEMALTGWPWQAQALPVPKVALIDTPDGKRLAAQYDRPPLLVNAWGVPVINAEIRLQKPPLPYWCSAIAYRVFGIGEATARLPNALLGVLATLLVYDLGRRLIRRDGGWIAALVWLSSYFVFDEFRKAMADPYLAVFCLAAVWAWVRGAEARRPESLRASGSWVIAFYAATALAILSKGPVAIIHVIVPLAAYHLGWRRRAPGGWTAHAIGAAVMLAIVLPWPIYVMRHVPNAVALWRYESLGEFTGENVEKARPFWFYLPQLPQLSLPWVIAWGAGVITLAARLIRRPTRAAWRRAMPLLWYATILAIFSLSGPKKNAYLLPTIPAQALLVAYALRLLLRLGARSRLAMALVKAQAVIGVGAGIAVAFVVLVQPIEQATGGVDSLGQILFHSSPQLRPALILAGLLAIAAAVAPVLVGARPARRWIVAQSLAYALAILLFFTMYEANFANARSPRQFMAEVEDAMVSRPGVVLSRARMQEAALFYLSRPMPDLRSDPQANGVLVILEDRRRRAHEPLGREYFGPDVPGRRVLSASEVPLPTASPRNRWRLYELIVE